MTVNLTSVPITCNMLEVRARLTAVNHLRVQTILVQTYRTQSLT